MQPIDVINKFLAEEQKVGRAIDHLFIPAHFKMPILDQEYYSRAEEISNIPDFEEVAAALLTAEKPRKIDPQTFLRIGIMISHEFERLIPQIDPSFGIHLKQLFQSLCQQVADRKCESFKYITDRIHHLLPGTSFPLLLPRATPWGKSLENIVVYKKNEDETFDITLFYAKKECWKEQGGEAAIGYEKQFPVRLFSHVPFQDLLGDDKEHPSSLHAKLILKALESPQYVEKGLVAVFSPLNGYLKEPEEPFRLIQAGHLHSLKAITAFLYIAIREESPQGALDKYKAFLCATRLLLSIAMLKSLAHEGKKEPFHSRIGLLAQTARAAARQINKLRDNPFFEPIYECAVGTATQLKDKAEKMLGTVLPPDQGITERNIQTNQAELRMQALQENKRFLQNFEQAVQTNNANHRLLVRIKDQPVDPAVWMDWLTDAAGQIDSLQQSYPELILPALTDLISSFELPHKDSLWLRMSESDRRQGLTIVATFTEMLTRNTFQQRLRHSLALQNCGAHLLLVGYAIAESLESRPILHRFKPCLKGYIKLTASPYFQAIPYREWLRRQKILDFIQNESGLRKYGWTFRHKDSLSYHETSDGLFTEALLAAHPEAQAVIESHMRILLKRKNEESLRGVIREQWFLAKLLNMKLPEDSELQLNLEDPKIYPLSRLSQIALYVHLLSDKSAIYHMGYENRITFDEGISFDLTFAKQQKNRFDFCSEDVNPEIRINAQQRNLLPKEKWSENQNRTIHRFCSNDEEFIDDQFVFEESASEAELDVVQLLSQAKFQLSHLHRPQIRASLERYLFKIRLAKEAREKMSICEEIQQHPQVINQLLEELLSAVFNFTKVGQHAIFSPQMECLVDLSLRLYSMAQHMSNPLILETIKKFIEQAEVRLKWNLEMIQEQQPNQSVKIQVFLLKILEMKPIDQVDWKQYFKWGTKLQEQLEQKEVLLSSTDQFWWNHLRWKMAHHLQLLNREKLQVFLDENFDPLAMSDGHGRSQPIPAKVLKNGEFIRLFSDRVRTWKIDEENHSITFSDPLSGKYRLRDVDTFPDTLQHYIEGVWYCYIPNNKSEKNLQIPKCISDESLWWLNPQHGNFSARGYYQGDPKKLWMERDKQGWITFTDGPEKGMRLELVPGDESVHSNLEIQTGAFGYHYYAYQTRYIHEELHQFRDLLIFPNLLMPHGEKLAFIQEGHTFFDLNNKDRWLDSSFFSPSNENLKATPIKIYGLQLKKKKHSGVGNEEQRFILVPFQRHVSDPHSSVIHTLSSKKNSENHSLLNSIKVIEIPINAHGFCPETAHETLFSAYLSLVGKDYFEAFRWIQAIRPNHRLDEKDRQILRWLIDSQEDAQDHSAVASAIKLMAYKIYGEQGVSLGEELGVEHPEVSIEAIYLNYLNHRTSVPDPLKISLALEEWLMARGFTHFPPTQFSKERWLSRKEDCLSKHQRVQTFAPPKPLRNSVVTKWKEFTLSEAPSADEIPYAMVEGILKSTEQILIPGKPYPFEAFGNHYQILSSETITEGEKWELIYTLETVELPEYFKALFAKAFQMKSGALNLPKLRQKTRFENMKIVSEWMQTVLQDHPLVVHHQEIKEEIRDQAIDNKACQHEPKNQQLAQNIKNRLAEEKQLPPYALIKALQEIFAAHVESKPFVEVDSPFEDIEVEDDSYANELNWYRKEWKKGVRLQQQSYYYPVPSLNEINQLLEILTIYKNEIHLESIQDKILKLVNRRSGDPAALAHSCLAEVLQNKAVFNFEDVLKTIFISNIQEKLRFLKRFNVFLTEEDVETLNLGLQEYLEWSISDKILGQLRGKLESIVEKVANEEHELWKNHPSIQETWQEIGELLNPVDHYSEDPQIHRETLLFESLCGFRIREQQAKIMHLIIEKIFGENPQENDFALVFQTMMGEGKTSVILAHMAKMAAKKGQVPIWLTYHAQHTFLQSNLINTQSKRLDQDVVDIEFNRTDLTSLKFLRDLYSQLNTAKDMGYLILLKIGLLLILRLEFVHQINRFRDPQNLDPSHFERIQELAKILEFIGNKKKSLLLCDEIDCIMNILEEINIPSGPSLVITQSSLDLIKQIYVHLSTHPETLQLLKFQEDEQSLISKKKLNELIFPKLVDHLINEYPPISHLIPLKNHQVLRESLKDYLLGKIDARLTDGIHSVDEEPFLHSLNLFDEKERQRAKKHLEFLRHLSFFKNQISEAAQNSLHAVGLAKELCTEILPIILRKSFNRSYGFVKGKIIPFAGVSAPNLTEFGNIYVMTCCYIQASLRKGVDADDLRNYRDKLRETSFYYSEFTHRALEKSAEAEHFKNLTALDLYSDWSEKELTQTLAEINQDPQRCIDFYAEFASLHLRYHSDLQNCGPIALSYLGGQFIGCSATLWNKDAFVRAIAKGCLLQQGTEGRILVKFAQDIAQKKSFFTVIEKADPHNILASILKNRGGEAASCLRAIIDVSGFLKRYSNLQVAKEILNFEPLKDQIDAVVFLHKVEKREFFAMLKRGAKEPSPLLSTQRKEIEKEGIPMERIFIYFDELRATGSDIYFKPDAIAAKTFDSYATTIRSDVQAALRARNFFREQVVDTIIQKEALEGFEGYDSQSPQSCLNTKNFFFTAIRNQSQMKKTQLLRSCLEQIREAYCGLIVKKFIADFSQVDEACHLECLELSHASHWLFHAKFLDDPITLFLDLKKEVQAFEVVESYLAQTQHRFMETCSHYFKMGDLELIDTTTKEIVAWSRQNLTWCVPNTHLNAHLEKQINVEKQNQLEVNTEIQSETQKELQKYAITIDAPIAKHIPWKKLKEQPLTFIDYQAPTILSLSKFLQRVSYDVPYHKIFPEDLYLTDNLARSHEMDLPVFHKTQKKIYHILLVQKGALFSALFIDMKEAAFWRQEISAHRLQDCWLVDLDGHSLNEGHRLPNEAGTHLLRMQWWGHFFNGNASFLRTYPHLIETELKNAEYKLKFRFLLLKTANHPLQAKILTIDPMLADKPLEAAPFQFNHKIEQNHWHSQEEEELDEEKINHLPFHFARFFSARQIPLLKRPGYFSYLAAEKFDFITRDQVKMVPNYRLQYLRRPEQIAQVDKAKVVWLKGEALKYIPEDFVEYINPQMLGELIPSLQKKYQKLQIEYQGIISFAKSIEPCMAPFLLPRCVEFISDSCLPFLKTEKQLARLSPAKYHLLHAHQLHLLPREQWDLLQIDAYDKFRLEKIIGEENRKLIQQMNLDWVNDVDPRLSRFFIKEQVMAITQPKIIPYLEEHQLCWLGTSMSRFLNQKQIASLSLEHSHLIQTFVDPTMLRQLSKEALLHLSRPQIEMIDDRETLLRLDSSFYSYLTKKQIVLLQSKKAEDQKIIQQLSQTQLQGLEKREILALLPYLNETVLKGIEAAFFEESVNLSCEVRQKLTPLQMQFFLRGLKNRKINPLKYLKEICAFQWQGMDDIFIETFFARKSKKIVQCVPQYRICHLPKEALLRWYDAYARGHLIRDIVTGLSALLFYPLVLLSVLFLVFLVQHKDTSWKKVCRKVAFSPLRFLSREKYYRLISEKI